MTDNIDATASSDASTNSAINAEAENPHSEQLERFDLIVLTIAGALAGTILYQLGQAEFDDTRLLALIGSTTFAAIASFMVLWSRDRMISRLAMTAAMAVLIGGITWLVAGNIVEGEGANNGFTAVFWVFPSVPLIGFLGMVFARVWLEEGLPLFAYPHIFRAGLNLPLQWGVGALLGGAVTLFVFLWAFAFEAAGWNGLKLAFEDGWIVLPLSGGITALATGLARSITRMRSALEAIILIAANIALPLLAVFSSLFAIAVLIGGMESLKAAGSPTAILLSLAIAAMLIFNGVYRDGSTTPGPVMRSFVWVTLATLPVYASLATYGIFIRVLEYGFTPSRFVVLIVTGLVALYTLLLLVSLIGDILRRNSPIWMPLVARLNTGFSALWLILLISFQLPFLSPDSYSASDQMARLIDGRTPHDKFDYSALRFDMGQPGRETINTLAELTEHPQAEQISASATQMRDRTSPWVTAPVATAEPDIDTAFSREFLERLEEINLIGQDAAWASYLAAGERLDSAQALLCELQGRDDLTDAEKRWAEARLASDVQQDYSSAAQALSRYPELTGLDRQADADNRRLSWDKRVCRSAGQKL